MKVHTPPMTFNPTDGAANWKRWHDANQDGYGYGVIRFASEWATQMEQRIAEKALPMASLPEQIAFMVNDAGPISHLADDEGITGFMYGAAVSVLSQCWAYGEALRRWHNKDTQLGTEGDRANESGGVLNPALLSIGA